MLRALLLANVLLKWLDANWLTHCSCVSTNDAFQLSHSQNEIELHEWKKSHCRFMNSKHFINIMIPFEWKWFYVKFIILKIIIFNVVSPKLVTWMIICLYFDLKVVQRSSNYFNSHLIMTLFSIKLKANFMGEPGFELLTVSLTFSFILINFWFDKAGHFSQNFVE